MEMMVHYTEGYFCNTSESWSMQGSCWESLKGIIGTHKGEGLSSDVI